MFLQKEYINFFKVVYTFSNNEVCPSGKGVYLYTHVTDIEYIPSLTRYPLEIYMSERAVCTIKES
jgi:hypothetical protein